MALIFYHLISSSVAGYQKGFSIATGIYYTALITMESLSTLSIITPKKWDQILSFCGRPRAGQVFIQAMLMEFRYSEDLHQNLGARGSASMALARASSLNYTLSLMSTAGLK